MDDVQAMQAFNQSQGSDPDTQAMQTFNNQSSVPASVQKASQYIGQPIDEGYCQTFAEQMTGEPNMGRSAAEAVTNYARMGKLNPDISSAPSGSLIYFAPDQSNGNSGHVGVADGQGGMISATYGGVKRTPLDQWIQSTGQQPVGYVVPGGQNVSN